MRMQSESVCVQALAANTDIYFLVINHDTNNYYTGQIIGLKPRLIMCVMAAS